MVPLCGINSIGRRVPLRRDGTIIILLEWRNWQTRPAIAGWGIINFAGVAELADALALGASRETCESSNLSSSTVKFNLRHISPRRDGGNSWEFDSPPKAHLLRPIK